MAALRRPCIASTGNLNFRHGLLEMAGAAAEAGIEGLELVMNQRAVEQALREGPRMVHDLPIPVVSLHAPYKWVPVWGDLATSLKKTIDFARAAGVARVVFHPPTPSAFQLGHSSVFWMTRDFQALGGGEVLVSMENMPRNLFSRLPGSLSEASTLKRFLERRNLALTFDTTHFAVGERVPQRALDALADRIVSVHLTNAPEHGTHDHLPPHLGRLDLADFMRRLPEREDIHIVFEIDFGLLKLSAIRRLWIESVAFVRRHATAALPRRHQDLSEMSF